MGCLWRQDFGIRIFVVKGREMKRGDGHCETKRTVPVFHRCFSGEAEQMERNLYYGEWGAAVVEDGVLAEYIPKDPSQQCGDILGGTVERIMPGIDGAFVKIGRKTAGFLPLRENSRSFVGGALKSGMKIPVQIRKEETGKKGAFLTRDLTLAGQAVLVMPMNRYIGVSSRIAEDAERERLREMGREIAAGVSYNAAAGDHAETGSYAGAGTDGNTEFGKNEPRFGIVMREAALREPRFGIVMREAALHSSREMIASEADGLAKVWAGVEKKIRDGFEAGEVLYHQDPVMQMIRDYEARGTVRRFETGEIPAELQRQLREAGERKVRLRNGGNIVIDRCEAMTVIDVNSGSARADGRVASSYLETNLAACGAIATQIRLRNLGGIILIDFIDMESDGDRARVEECMREMLAADRRKTVIHGWTRLGIMEMTRKRTEREWQTGRE